MARLLSRLSLAVLFAFSLACGVTRAPQAQSAPDIPIASSEDLGKLEAKIRAVAKQNRAAVVGLRMGASSGSGCFISEDGWIATAGHVSGQRPGVKCRVIGFGGEEYSATVAGYYQSMDQGLVKADTKGKKVPFVQFGDSNKVTTGQWVIAMGHPLGVERGRDAVVRAGRVINPKNPFSMIVMDAPVISGDSGGPVFDLNGRLIAINQSIQTNSVTINNVTPVATMVEALDKLKSGEKLGMDRPLGRGTSGPKGELTPREQQNYARAMQLHQAKKYDEAYKLMEPLTQKKDCPSEVLYNAACAASLQSATLTDKAQEELQKTAVQLLVRSVEAGWADVNHVRKDTDLDPLRKRKDYVAFEELCAAAGLTPVVGLVVRSAQGVRVSEVRANSPASSAGFEKDDVITHLGGVKISDGNDWFNLVMQNGAEAAVEFAVMRGSKKLKLKLRVPAFGARVATYGGAQVKEVAENSTAYKAGIKRDDVITQVGSAKITNVLDFANALMCIDDDSETAINIKRGGEKMVIQFQYEAVEEPVAGGWLKRADQKQGDNMLKLWDKLLANHASPIFIVKQKGRQAAFATAVDAAGYLVTKASEVDAKDPITLIDDDGKEMSATVVAKDGKTDIALLKVATPLKNVIKFDEKRKTSSGEEAGDIPAIGTILATLDSKGHALTQGFIALPGYNSDALGKPSPEDAVMGVTPDMNSQSGVKVSALSKDGPAEKAGIKVGDTITRFGGREVKSTEDLLSGLSGKSAGDTVKVEVERDGKKVELEVRLASRREMYPDGKAPDGEKPGTGKPYLGIVDARPAKPEGATLNVITEGSPADLAGLQKGDVLLSIDDTPVANLRGINTIVEKKKPGDSIKVKVKQDGKDVELEIELAEQDAPLQPQRPGMPNVKGPINDRADKFGTVIQHDGVVLPYQQGSPVIDLRGNIVGLNIARSDRTRTFALPASRVAAVVKKLVAEAKAAPATTPSGDEK